MSDEDSGPKPPLAVPIAATAVVAVPTPSPANTVEFKPKIDTVCRTVRKLAADTANIKWSKHALERMAERGITDKYVLDAMRHGMAKGDIAPGAKPGEWKIKMTHRAKGRREVGVVVIVVHSKHLLVKTTEWEDLT